MHRGHEAHAEVGEHCQGTQQSELLRPRTVRREALRSMNNHPTRNPMRRAGDSSAGTVGKQLGDGTGWSEWCPVWGDIAVGCLWGPRLDASV